MKSLYVPAKVWLDQKSFIKDFPQLKTAVLMLLVDNIFRGGNPLSWAGIDQQTYRRTMEAYKDSIVYALTPEKPMIINVTCALAPMGKVSELKDFFKNLPEPCKYHYEAEMESKSLYEWKGFSTGGGLTWNINTLSVLQQIILLGTDKIIKLRNLNYPGGIPYKEFIYCVATYRNKLIDLYIKYGFSYFEVRAPSEYTNFDEIYGVTDISKVPPKTISYCVKNLPPPVPESIDWKNVQFWSALFEDNIGKSILNAVIRNLPVSITTIVTNWKNPDQKLSGVVTKETEKYIQYTFTYVWNDFKIAVDTKSSVLIQYDRGVDSASTIHIKESFSAWLEILKGVGFVVGAMALAAAAGAALTAAGVVGTPGSAAAAEAAAMEGSIAAGSASGVTSVGMSSISLTGGSVATGAGLTGTAATVKATTAAAGSKASIWSAVLKAAPKIVPAVAKLGVGLWSASEKAKIQKQLAEMGFTPDQINAMPEGLTADGNYVYKEAGIMGGLDPKIILLVLAGAGILALAFGQPVGKTKGKKK
jgi:hypothetical protein